MDIMVYIEDDLVEYVFVDGNLFFVGEYVVIFLFKVVVRCLGIIILYVGFIF